MFERRLKIFLGILLGCMSVLLLRAIHLQVVTRSQWLKEAEDFNKRTAYVETTRGRILDHMDREIAVDEACMDACVDYRAISRNEKWLKEIAAARLADNLGDQYRKAARTQRDKMVADEVDPVNKDIDAMWDLLAKESKQTREQIDEVCHGIDLKVAMRARWVQYKRYQNAGAAQAGKDPSPWYRRWLIEGGDGGPKVDDFAQESGEQVDVYPILKDISPDVYMRLAKASDHCPGLVLKPGTHRKYPFGRAGAHLLGQLTPVTKQDMMDDPNLGVDPLRKYDFTDLIGRGGLEGLCEPTLRGSRGEVLRQLGKVDEPVSAPVPGGEVKSTIDIALQGEIQKMFANMKVPNNKDPEHLPPIEVPGGMHGAVVVIDIPTGQVRAMTSYPDYDANDLAENYEKLTSKDQEIEAPLLNRATMSQLEPGSTIKPAVGLGAITQGHISPTTGIECTGFLVIGGKKRPNGRCWVATRWFEKLNGAVAHHPIPVPHKGRFGNPDGYLCYADALERSCNVFFENCADQMGLEGLSDWLDHMGLGHETGIGIYEARGTIPRDMIAMAAGPGGGAVSLPQSVVWFSGIGQTGIRATPIQMANIAATIARDGIWMRPKLVESADATLSPYQPKGGRQIPDSVDLKIDKGALAAAREGMVNVVNGESGTGRQAHMDNLLVAGKTGTAQAAKLRDKETVVDGQVVHVPRVLATADQQTDTPWYRGWGEDGQSLNHGWFIGFAPANKPQVAFAVMIEYGGSGGFAGHVATQVLNRCIDHGYVKP